MNSNNSIQARILHRVKSSMLKERGSVFFGTSNTLKNLRPPSVFYAPTGMAKEETDARPLSIQPFAKRSLKSRNLDGGQHTARNLDFGDVSEISANKYGATLPHRFTISKKTGSSLNLRLKLVSQDGSNKG